MTTEPVGAGGYHAANNGGGRTNGTPRLVRDVTTLGWTDCECSADGSHWRPGVVLDPFGGSGTTAVAAALEGRDAVLIDLDARNVDLVRRRLTETVRIVKQRSHQTHAGAPRSYRGQRRQTLRGGRFVWTVDVRLPREKRPVLGQTNLLDLLEGTAA